MKLILENIRSFTKRNCIEIKPLTLLVGENSSGKSTFLAALSAASDRENYPFATAFNQAPYNLGSYDTIATFKGGSYGKAKYFKLGYEQEIEGEKIIVEAKYTESSGQVVIRNFTISYRDQRIELDVEKATSDKLSGTFSYKSKNLSFDSDISQFPSEISDNVVSLRDVLMGSIILGPDSETTNKSEVMLKAIELTGHARPKPTISISPIRTKPERIYGGGNYQYNPSGDHIPYLLANLIGQRTISRKNKDNVNEALDWFGDRSEMFSNLKIKTFNNKYSGPFQLMVSIHNRPVNLVDVGYGVSQVLPIIVQSVLIERNKRLLLQQPEVHLHPKAQATLGTFLARRVYDQGLNVIIETHSDFIIDRIRQVVANEPLDNNDVSILFFERNAYDTKIHSLTLDKHGNIINAPSKYRSFFLQEELNLIRRAI